VAAALTVVAVNQRGRAERVSRFATARELAGAAMTNIDVDADRSLLLALQAVETTRGPDGTAVREAEAALHAALQAHRLLFSVPGVEHLDFSPDGTQLVTGGEDGTIHTHDTAAGGTAVWDVETGERVSGLDGYGYLAFAPDGRRLLIADSYQRDPELGWVAGYVVDWRRDRVRRS
jgi:WD40 repeat protein